jgi:hypothetical protein
MAEASRTAPGQTGRRTTGKLTPIEGEKGAPRKIFSKKDLVESVRRMAPARYGNNAVPKGSSVNLGRAGDAPENSQLDVMSNGVNMNAKKFNDLKLLGDRKAKELKTKLDVLTCLKMENDALVEMKKKETPESIRIEELMVKIEKVRVQTEEKLHYRRQLQHMKRRLAANQITFDAHINAMEDALRSSIREHDEVKALMRQLEAGKTKAVLDLHDIQREVSVERRDRTKILTARQMEAQNAEKMETWRQEREVMRKEFASELRGDLSVEQERALVQRLEEREALARELREANEAKLREFNALEEQFTAIRQATGVNSLEEMVEKFIGQEGNRETLLNEQIEVESKLVEAKAKKEEAEKLFSELKASGIGGTELNREIVGELMHEIQAGRMELKVNKAACERLENVLVSLRQGAIGLFQRLEGFMSLLEADGVQAGDVATMEPIEAINLSELLLSKMMESVGGGETSPSRFGQAISSPGMGDDASAVDEQSSTWSALGGEDVPNSNSNVRVRTTKQTQLALEQDPADAKVGAAGGAGMDEGMDKEGLGMGDSAGPAAGPATEGDAEAVAEMVPSRDFLKLASTRQTAEVMRKQEAEVRRKKMQERYDAAEPEEKAKLGSLADKKKRQREAINKLSENKDLVGVPPGVTPKLDAMTRAQIFLDEKPMLL